MADVTLQQFNRCISSRTKSIFTLSAILRDVMPHSKKQMRLIFAYLISIILTTHSFGQTKAPYDFGLSQYSIHYDTLGEINFYVTQRDIEQQKPLLLFLDGSGFQ